MTKKTIIITGGNRGIGLSITQAFLKDGNNVYVGSRKIADLESLKNDNLIFIPTDVRKEEDVCKLVQRAKSDTGRLDVFINNAGYSEWRPIEKIDEHFLNDIISTNLNGAFWGCKAAIANMNSDGGSIINISSIAGKRGSSNNSAYVATKFGMNGLTQALAKEVGPKGIRVNAISAGPIKTLAASAIGDAKFLYKWNEDHSFLKRNVDIHDVGNSALYLMSDLAAGVTGEIHYVDAGYNKVGMPDPKNIKN